MTIAGIKPGDVVQADVRGDRFYALVTGKADGMVETHPIGNGRGYVRFLKPRQIRGHWRATAATKKARAA